MQSGDHRRRLTLQKGSYIGDVSALCLLPCPLDGHYPFLLAGTGPQLLLYDLDAVELLLSYHAFDGVRVHGIEGCSDSWRLASAPDLSGFCTTIAVHGEKRVKLFEILAEQVSAGIMKSPRKMQLKLYCTLPRLKHWVLDVRFVTEASSVGEGKAGRFLAVGASDNSVHLWDIQRSSFVHHVECTERCLLYSMRLWGESIRALHVAAGTIFNEVIVWKLANKLTEFLYNRHLMDEESHSVKNVGCCVVPPSRRLNGHEGSIFRIAWSHDGRQLASVSDDRSARIWSQNTCTTHCNSDASSAVDLELQVGPVCYGHTARLWDCHIDQKFLITASEDCTFRIWNLDGRQLAKIKAHTGRGIWRCVYDAKNSLLVTAGADASIKVQPLHDLLLESGLIVQGHIHLRPLFQNKECNGDEFLFPLRLLDTCSKSKGNNDPLDSKSEFVRCLFLVRPTCLYIATNLGFLHYVKLTGEGEDTWTVIYQVDDLVPIVCMDVLSPTPGNFERDSPNDQCNHEDHIAFGDGKGRAMVLCWNFHGYYVTSECSWSAEDERQLLGIYWCKALGNSYIFATDPRGGLCLWVLEYSSNRSDKGLERKFPAESSDFVMQKSEGNSLCKKARLLFRYKSSFPARIVCVDGCLELEILVCGDQKGNILTFPLQKRLFHHNDSDHSSEIQPLAVFKGAHGVSTVASVRILDQRFCKQVDIISTGRDGCICKFIYSGPDQETQGHRGIIVCLQVENVASITVIESVAFCKGLFRDTLKRRVVAGFTAVDFLLWDLQNDSKLVRVSCGGWRRPHSYLIGDIPETQYCFVYMKDHLIHVHRKWLSPPLKQSGTSLLQMYSRVHFSSLSLHTQFHGREVHTVHFIPGAGGSCLNYGTQVSEPISWVATGSEDGGVRIIRYNQTALLQFDISTVLGEHVGGSAVRAITVVSDSHLLCLDPSHGGECNASKGALREEHKTMVLISAGAKEVMTCWLLEWVEERNPGEIGHLMLSSQWLSSHMQSRVRKPPQRLVKDEQKGFGGLGTVVPPVLNPDKSKCEKGILLSVEGGQGDWRYMAVTAFSVCCPYTRLLTCFVVTASSNTSLIVHAFHLSTRVWIEVAVLDYHKAPVLALQHLVVPIHETNQGSKNLYLVFSGATDGNIAFWNITELVRSFTRNCSNIKMGKSMLPVHRPPSGRGSQGGRRWKLSRLQAKVQSSCNAKEKRGKTPVSNSEENVLWVTQDEEATKLTDYKELEEVNSACSSVSININCGVELNVDGPSLLISQENNLTDQHIQERHKQFPLEVSMTMAPVKENMCDSPRNELATGYNTGDNRARSIPLNSTPNHPESLQAAYKSKTSVVEVNKVYPCYVLTSAHQSGVNCLSVSKVKTTGDNTNHQVLAVVSGGDDQALCVAIFKIDETNFSSLGGSEKCDMCEEASNIIGLSKFPGSITEIGEDKDQVLGSSRQEGSAGVPKDITFNREEDIPQYTGTLVCLSHQVLPSVHSSAIKGVWTDGKYVFSTGLDQRLRCWRLNYPSQGSFLVECCHSVINVPEPAALHVRHINRCGYQVAVVGRGLQIMEMMEGVICRQPD